VALPRGKKKGNPYIKKRGDKWVIVQKGTGKVLSHHDSKAGWVKVRVTSYDTSGTGMLNFGALSAS
jgi:hypothetical protein